MAEALLRARLGTAGVDAVVQSAGDLHAGVPAASGAVRAMRARGLDLSSHRSRSLTGDLLDRADVVIAMARRHVRSAVSLRPGAWPRAFTLKELVRRGSGIGPRKPGESFDDWLGRIHAGRERRALLGDDPRDDIADPIGGPDRLYEATAVELGQLVDDLVSLAFPKET